MTTSDLPQLPPRDPATHKGRVGRVALAAGSRGMSGAAVLAGLGALRGGAGLVRVYCPDGIQATVAAAEPCLMTTGLAEDARGHVAGPAAAAVLEPAAAPPPSASVAQAAVPPSPWANVLALGPGLGQSAGVGEFVRALLTGFAGPVVLDADGLNMLGTAAPGVWAARSARMTVITPHPGEMARLRQAAGMPELPGADDDTRQRIAREYAERFGVVVVLKGYRTVVSARDAQYVNPTGNPGMATGGMGDVLTGLVAALLGQGLGAFDAARLGVYVHGAAADRCAREIGPAGYLAREVADRIPGVLHEAGRARIGFI